MDFKMEVNRLCQDELVYKLKIRGVTEVLTVSNMRTTLRQLLPLEESPSFVAPVYPYTFVEDVAAITAKIESIQKSIVDNEQDLGLVYKKLSTQ